MEYYKNNDWRDYIRSRNELMHYGIPKKSGRYPWGSGEDPYHHGEDSPGSRGTKKKKKPGKIVKAIQRNRSAKRDSALARKENRRDKKEARQRAISEEKNLAGKVKTAVLGNDKLRAEQKRIDSKTNHRISLNEMRRKNYARSLDYSNKSFNDKHLAEYYEKRSNMSGKQRIKEGLLKGEYFRTPCKTKFGKTSTIGKEKLKKDAAKVMSLAYREVTTNGAGIKAVEAAFVTGYAAYKLYKGQREANMPIGIPEQKEKRLHTFDGRHYW